MIAKSSLLALLVGAVILFSKEVPASIIQTPNCRIPDDYIDARRYPLLAAREVMRQVVDDLLGRSTFAPGALA